MSLQSRQSVNRVLLFHFAYSNNCCVQLRRAKIVISHWMPMWMHKQPSMPGGCEKYLLCPGTSFDQRISNIGELKVWHAVQFHALSTSSELRRQWPFDLFIPHQYQKLIQKRNDQAQGEIWDKSLKVKILQATKPFKVFQSHQKNHPCYCWFVERSPVLQRGVSWLGGFWMKSSTICVAFDIPSEKWPVSESRSNHPSTS